jgi:hypothetical protein
MQRFCEEFGPCSVIPPEWPWIMAIVMPLLMIILVGVPVANILHRGPQPLVDDAGIHPVAKLDRPVGVCIHAMAESRQLERLQLN